MSIYNTIVENINDDGRLPSGFSLETIGKGNNNKVAAGLIDGTLIYHTVNSGNSGNTKETANKIAALLVKYFESGDELYIKKNQRYP